MLRKAKRAAVKAGRTTRKKTAATADLLEMMVATCRSVALDDIRDKGLLMVGFASGGRRRSELAAFLVDDLAEVPGGGFTITLRASKTDQEGKGRVLPVKGRAALALKEWIAAASITSGPLFRSVNQWGQVGASITGRGIANVVKKRAEMAGLDPAAFGGHSLRSGFITESGRRKIALGDAMALSGHKSVPVAQGYYQSGDVLNNLAGELLGMGA